MSRRFFITIILLCISYKGNAQLQKPVTWSYAANRINAKEAIVYFKVNIDKGWHIYSTVQRDGGPLKTSFSFRADKGYLLLGKIIEPKPVKKFEKVFNMDVLYFENSVTFSQKIQLKKSFPIVFKGKFEYMVCTDKECLPPDEVIFSIPIK